MHWHDPVMERGVTMNLSSLIEVWDDKPTVLAQTMERGFSVVYAGSYYLDHLDLDWEDSLYTADPGNFQEVLALPAAAQQLLKGIEACLWSESVDRTNVVQRV